MVIGGWYSAVYIYDFKITFQVLTLGSEMTICREDGAITNYIPTGYKELISHGDTPPLS